MLLNLRMNDLKNKLVVFAAFVLPLISCYGQAVKSDDNDEDSVYNKLFAAFEKIEFNNRDAPRLKLPKRKYDSPLFVTELIPFRSGYIVNSISSSRGAAVEFCYNFFYINLTDNRLTKIKLEELDTIHSVVADKNIVYAAGKKGDRFRIIRYSEMGIRELSFDPGIDSIIQRKYNWIGFGLDKNELVALFNNGIARYRADHWNYLPEYSLETILAESGRVSKRWLMPTENIRVRGNKIFFNYEVTQDRRSNLFEIDLQKPGEVSDFFHKYRLSDNTLKEIDSYIIGSDGRLYVSITRLMVNSIVLCASDTSISTLILNGQLKNNVNGDTPIDAHCMVEDATGKLIFANNGVFEWKKDTILPLLFWDNVSQDVKMKS